MTHHGFGGIVCSSSLDDIAKKVSKVKGVKKAVVVYGPLYDIIVEIDLGKPREKIPLENLLADIYKISGIQRIDPWIGKDDYWYDEKGNKKQTPMP